MKLFILLFILQAFALTTSAAELTSEVVPLNQLAKKFVEDIERIEVFYPKQFERLEMDWKKTSAAYVKQYEAEKDLDKKLNIFARLYNSWNNGHHRPMTVKGYLKDMPKDVLELPVRFFGQGLKLSEARFFIDDLPKEGAPPNINVGDEVLSYNDIPIKEYVIKARDEIGNESPEAHIEATSASMANQSRCRWGKLRCWALNDSVKLTLKDVKTGETKKLSLNWRARIKKAFPASPKEPQFIADEKSWSYKPLLGTYGIDYGAVPDEEHGFYGVLQNGNRKWLVIKIFLFRDIDFVQAAIKEARKEEYEGVILDFADNGGGKDSAMTFMAGMLGIKYQLELSSIRLVKEFRDYEVLKEATFASQKADHLFKLMNSESSNKMSPFTPFGCLDDTCPLKTSYSDYLDYWVKPAIQSDKPIQKIALITGRGTASKTDSIAALFRTTKAGPIIGTPAIASSGTYYFRKEYLVQTGKNIVTVGVTFTPDFSLGGDCEEVQANPPQPNVLVERTFENRKVYDTRTWIESAKAMDSWTEKADIERSCDLDAAKKKLQAFGLKQSDPSH